MLNIYAASVVGLGLIGYCLMRFSVDGYAVKHSMSWSFGFISCIACLVGLIFGLMFSYGWYSSGHKAKIINREYNTSYTQEEIFYAEDVIETIREIKRQRNEVKVEVK